MVEEVEEEVEGVEGGEEEGDQRDSQWEGEEEGTPSPPPLWVQLAHSAKTLSENRRWFRHVNSLSMQPTNDIGCHLLTAEL